MLARTFEMFMDQPSVTQLLGEWRQGSSEAHEQLAEAVYLELRRLAHYQMRHERQGHLLQTTALVNEAYLRLVDLRVDWQDRGHFYKVAARQMRRVLVDAARKRRAKKRGDELQVPIETVHVAIEPSFEILELDQALSRLGEKDRRKVQVVELRIFGGLSIEETAKVLDVSHATVERDLNMAKAWLRRAMAASP